MTDQNLEYAIKFYEKELGERLSKDVFWDAVAVTTIKEAEDVVMDYLDLLDLKYVGLLVNKYKVIMFE